MENVPRTYSRSTCSQRHRWPAIQAGEQLINVWPEMGQRLRISRSKAWELVSTRTIGSVTIGSRRLVPSSWVDVYLNDLAEDTAMRTVK